MQHTVTVRAGSRVTRERRDGACAGGCSGSGGIAKVENSATHSPDKLFLMKRQLFGFVTGNLFRLRSKLPPLSVLIRLGAAAAAAASAAAAAAAVLCSHYALSFI